jgi:putative membrane protein
VKTNEPLAGETREDTTDATSLALDRTVLANERTYAAWIRTGLAALATGLAISKFLTEVMPVWSIRVIGAVLIGFSAVAFVVAAWRYQHLHIKVSHLDVDVVPLIVIRVVSFVLACSSIIAFIYAW